MPSLLFFQQSLWPVEMEWKKFPPVPGIQMLGNWNELQQPMGLNSERFGWGSLGSLGRFYHICYIGDHRTVSLHFQSFFFFFARQKLYYFFHTYVSGFFLSESFPFRLLQNIE